MKICLLGDTHFGVRNDNPFFHKHFEKFYTECFFPTLEANNVKYVIQLGDLFDRRKHINFNTLSLCRKYFLNPLNANYKSWILVGNHDSYYKNTIEINSTQLLLSEYKNIHGIISPYETSFDGINFLFVPWICDDNVVEVNKTINLSDSSIVVGHFELNGFEMYKGSVHQGGMEKDNLSKFEFVFSGHFHHKSQQSNVYYLGTPYEMTWSDYDDPKGFHLFDTTTRTLEFIPNPFKMFHKIFYDDKDQSTITNLDLTTYTESFVKVVVVSKTNPYMFDLFIDRLEKAGVYNVQVVDDHLNLGYTSDDDIVSSAEDTLSILTKHIQQFEDTVDKQELQKLMNELYHEALSVT